jgi:hypothetical protein
MVVNLRAVPLIEMRVPADTNFTMQKIVPSPEQSGDHASGQLPLPACERP